MFPTHIFRTSRCALYHTCKDARALSETIVLDKSHPVGQAYTSRCQPERSEEREQATRQVSNGLLEALRALTPFRQRIAAGENGGWGGSGMWHVRAS